MPIVTTEGCERCGGDGMYQGGTCDMCSGTGEVPIKGCTHSQSEWNIKQAVLELDDALFKLNALDTKVTAIADQVQALYDDLNP